MANEMEKVQTYFHQTASAFDSIYTGEKSKLSRLLDRIFRKDMYLRYKITLKECGDIRGKAILDIGCGSGKYCIAFAKMGARKVVGLDFAENMLNLARRYALEEGVDDVCSFINADFLKYHLDETFDITIAVGLFDYISNLQDFLNKIRQLTLEKVIATFPIKWTYRMPIRKIRLRLKGCPVYFYTERHILRLFRSAGFREPIVKKIGKVYFVVGEPMVKAFSKYVCPSCQSSADLVEVLEKIRSGTVELKGYEGKGSYFSFPTKEDVKEFKRRGNRFAMNRICMLSFDVEDYFQVDNLKGAIKRNEWDGKTLRVGENTKRLLDILDKYETKATFFVLGWIADKVPDLISEIHKAGHEIASHGYGHELLYSLTEEEFRKDIRRSKSLLEEITNEKVFGYRAPNFSITERALDILKEEGFRYDSSLFPSMMHDRYGKVTSVRLDGKVSVEKAREDLYEVLIPTLDLFGKRIPWGGGAYFRMLPYPVYKSGIKRILKDRESFLFYLHPWEIDPKQPRIEGIKLNYRIRHYTGQNKAEYKLDRLIGDFEFTTIKNGLKKLGILLEA